MLKRVTLLRRKDGMTDAEFRKHWAEPHAEIAKGFAGLACYNQNRVDEVVWQTGETRFDTHGIVELWFSSQEALDFNATSETSAALVVDELKFLSSLTALSAGDSWISSPTDICAKYMILAATDNADALHAAIERAMPKQGEDAPAEYVVDLLEMSFTREALMSEPVPPSVSVTVWTRKGGSAGLVRGQDAALKGVFEEHANAATAYLVDELRIV